jgi:hypothetical protein
MAVEAASPVIGSPPAREMSDARNEFFPWCSPRDADP